MAIILSAMVALPPLILAPHLLFYYDVTPKVAVSRSRKLTSRKERPWAGRRELSRRRAETA